MVYISYTGTYSYLGGKISDVFLLVDSSFSDMVMALTDFQHFCEAFSIYFHYYAHSSDTI